MSCSLSMAENSIRKNLLGNDYDQFTKLQENGFQIPSIISLVSMWPKVPSEFKLQVVAESLLMHYKENPQFDQTLSCVIKTLKGFDKTTAYYRLSKIINNFLHQQWTSLPCSSLSSEDAYRLFPQQALATPHSYPEKPIKAEFSMWKGYPSKILNIPLEWEWALDSFSSLINHIPQPKNCTVIGFGKGEELLVLQNKWPSTSIHGFEVPGKKNNFELSEKVKVFYDDCPNSYKG